MEDFAQRLIDWQRQNGRHDLPWQQDHDPYRIWVSEVMLQQTQVETVIPYYRRFLERFPDVAALAAAPLDEVLALWSGLGYYARARHLHSAARRIVSEHGGRFPEDFAAIAALPGVGRSTAAAIAVFAYGERQAILDGNARRVLCRVFGIEGWPGEPAVTARLWRLAESLLPQRDLPAYTQGLMDLGATVCTRARPRCDVCPMTACVARNTGRQHVLPTPRPRRDLPERPKAVLVLMHGGEVLLERRAPTGVWGGLWSLPECEIGADPIEAAQALGCQAERVESLPRLTHALTHFRLVMQPWLVHVSRVARVAEANGRLWLPADAALDAALPSPVRRLLASLSPRAGPA